MKKIISLFERDFSGNRQVYDVVSDGALWVTEGEGVATQKYDGTCCLIKGGVFYKRYTLRRRKTAPDDFIPATTVDPVTGKQEGWVLVKPGDKWHNEAFVDTMQDGTYELCGPKVQGNPEGYSKHLLVSHALAREIPDCPRSFDELKEFLKHQDIEGIVWHHPDGRMVKIKKSDFGLGR